MSQIKETVKKVLSDKKIKQRFNEIKEDLQKLIDDNHIDLLVKFIEKIGQELNILNDQELFGDLLQATVYLNEQPDQEFKIKLNALGKKYNVLGLNFKHF